MSIITLPTIAGSKPLNPFFRLEDKHIHPTDRHLFTGTFPHWVTERDADPIINVDEILYPLICDEVYSVTLYAVFQTHSERALFYLFGRVTHFSFFLHATENDPELFTITNTLFTLLIQERAVDDPDAKKYILDNRINLWNRYGKSLLGIMYDFANRLSTHAKYPSDEPTPKPRPYHVSFPTIPAPEHHSMQLFCRSRRSRKHEVNCYTCNWVFDTRRESYHTTLTCPQLRCPNCYQYAPGHRANACPTRPTIHNDFEQSFPNQTSACFRRNARSGILNTTPLRRSTRISSRKNL
jgi:hypothetical protein